MKNASTFCFIILTGALLVLSSPSNAKGAQCDALPKVEWWSDSHSKVSATVERRYQGDWNKYIRKWKSYQRRMQKLHKAGSIAVVKSRGLRLQGKQLANHIDDIRARINVLYCLKKNYEEGIGEDLEQLETAAGGPPPKEFQRPEVEQQIASLPIQKLDVEVTAKCVNDTAVFQITNLGAKWPRLGEINIYRVEGTSLLSKRRVRMANSQQATFRIRRRGGGGYGSVGVWISPSWKKRAFKYDAKITCN